MKKTALALLTLLSILALPPLSLALEKGTAAPDFELPSLEGKKVRLSDFKGQIILLKLATTWCPTCKQQSNEFRQAADDLEKNNVAVVEVFLQDSEEMIREYFKGQESTVPIVKLIDNGPARKAYNVYLIPRVLLIDQDFKIQRDGSLITAYDLTRRIEKLAAGSN
ncbi:thiol:disulfide interchange protein tlpA [Desulfuromonas versatilis]|uniref:Thiol:disulfide interchange protein tlpA n=1 Tax=Desulfuromonas versatilis TaxID=2802975 RepID=A0ABM8HR80_9BACT|nr:redoxin domain-containing protein [Desulfuromonas versatilis]BCR03051.1 thiol:disulfide interchange protein tlpA [Desulfuromonas versatilis]